MISTFCVQLVIVKKALQNWSWWWNSKATHSI